MSILIKTFSRIPVNFRQLARYSVHITNRTDSFIFKSNFTTEEQEKVLNILNESNPEQLTRFSISQNRIKNLVNWKNKKGPFRTLNDVLEVDGLGEKVLEKICEQIITDSDNEQHETKAFNRNNVMNKRLRQFVTPPLNGQLTNNIQSVVGIHLVPMGISWAKLIREQNKLTNWDYEDFSTLPKKILPSDTFEMAIKIMHRLPFADVYILEANPSPSPQSSLQSATVTSYTQQLELASMLIALINTSPEHNVQLQNLEPNAKLEDTIENRVFHLRARTPARLFKTLVGTEKVAALKVVTDLVENGTDKFSLPCTPITLDQQLRDAFLLKSSANKELLGQSLMLVVSFMDLCIYKNPVSLGALTPNKKRL